MCLFLLRFWVNVSVAAAEYLGSVYRTEHNCQIQVTRRSEEEVQVLCDAPEWFLV